MDAFIENEKKGKGVSKILLVAIGAAVLLVAVGLGFWSLRPPMEVQKQQMLEGAFLEGSPEFEALTKRIVVLNDADNTTQSFTGMGTITMFIRGDIRNNSDKNITGLEVKVGVLDPFDKVIKEKKQIIIPQYKENLAPSETMNVQIPVEGFSKDDDRARVQWKVTAIKVKE